MRRNTLERALDSVTGTAHEYYEVSVQDTQNTDPRIVGRWPKLEHAKQHQQRLLEASEYHAVTWRLVR